LTIAGSPVAESPVADTPVADTPVADTPVAEALTDGAADVPEIAAPALEFATAAFVAAAMLVL